MRTWLARVLAAGLLATAACESMTLADGEVADEVEEEDLEALASGPIMVSRLSPTGLTLAQGQLHWTSLDMEASSDFAMLLRAEPNNVPGNEALVVQFVGNPGPSDIFDFGNLTLVGSGDSAVYYMFYDRSLAGEAQMSLLRVPFNGGSYTVVAVDSYVFESPILSDGTDLYWFDQLYIRRLPLAGGLASNILQVKTRALALESSFIYYTDLTRIRRMRKTDGLRETVATATSQVTALHVDPASGIVYWGEAGGAVRSQPVIGGPVTTYQNPIAGRSVNAIGFDGSRVLWIDCVGFPRTECSVNAFQAGVTTALTSGVEGAGHLQWDGTTTYWGQSDGLMKYVH